MTSYDTQNSHLTGLISVNPVGQRAPKKNPDIFMYTRCLLTKNDI